MADIGVYIISHLTSHLAFALLFQLIYPESSQGEAKPAPPLIAPPIQGLTFVMQTNNLNYALATDGANWPAYRDRMGIC